MNVYLIISESFVFIKTNIQKITNGNTDIIKYDLLNTSLESILFDACSVSLFDDKKSIVVDNADEIFTKSYTNDDLIKYLENPSQTTDIIFVCKKADKSNLFYKKILKDFNVLDNTEKKYVNNVLEVKNYVKSKKSHISDKALEYIKDATLNNYDLMISEIDKLLILGKNNISDELVYSLVALSPDGNTNRLIDALLSMDEGEALKCIKNMEVLNIDLTKMIALLAWNVRVTYLIKIYKKDKEHLNDVLSSYKIPDFKYNKYVKMGNIRSEADFENIIVELSNLDEKIKKYATAREVVGYYLLNMFCI